MLKRNRGNFFVTICIQLMILSISSAQIVSPFNKLRINDSGSAYSFIVSGHFHGASTNISTFPASSLQANIDTLNSLAPVFLMSLGDLFLDVNETYIYHYRKSLFDKLKMPLFNAVGNHDIANGNMYEKVYGKTFFSFTVKSELFIVLNTEVNDGSIKNEQLAFLKNILNADSLKQIKNIFIFSHRPVWAEANDKYSKLFEGNTRSQFGKNNFSEEIEPIIKNISKSKNIYWLSGSMGGGPASFFYDKDPVTNITFIQTAIRDLPRDAVLQININSGSVLFKGISLTGQQLEPVENYNMDYWSKTIAPEKTFNYRLLPYLTKQMLMHQYFWIGFFSSVLLIFFITIIRKRWKKRK